MSETDSNDDHDDDDQDDDDEEGISPFGLEYGGERVLTLIIYFLVPIKIYPLVRVEELQLCCDSRGFQYSFNTNLYYLSSDR